LLNAKAIRARSKEFHMPSFLRCLAPALLLAGACQPGNERIIEDTAQEHAIDPAAVADTLAQLAGAFSRAYMEQDLSTIAASYSQDAIALPGAGDMVEGRDAIAALFAMPDGSSVVHHRIIPHRVDVHGDMASDVGVYEFQGAADGDTLPLREGKYAIVWRRGDDGIWRMTVDMWASRPAPVQPSEGTENPDD
jgi:ketosteroid isomerase-like protein